MSLLVSESEQKAEKLSSLLNCQPYTTAHDGFVPSCCCFFAVPVVRNNPPGAKSTTSLLGLKLLKAHSAAWKQAKAARTNASGGSPISSSTAANVPVEVGGIASDVPKPDVEVTKKAEEEVASVPTENVRNIHPFILFYFLFFFLSDEPFLSILT